tara:strand:- start:4302 stop:4919 length:618 start_codon:yes stop_codon:yes gene_type:complete
MDNKQKLRKNGYIVKLQGKEYVTHAGLLWLAHENGLAGVNVTIVSWDPKERAAVTTATATGERGTFTDIGDADPSNVGRNIATACLRMSSTRSSSRALRLYLGLGMTALEELPGKPEAKPVKAHDNDFKVNRGSFMGTLKEIGWSYEEVTFICKQLGKDRPSQMEQTQRNGLVKWLSELSPEKAEEWKLLHDEHQQIKKEETNAS